MALIKCPECGNIALTTDYLNGATKTPRGQCKRPVRISPPLCRGGDGVKKKRPLRRSGTWFQIWHPIARNAEKPLDEILVVILLTLSQFADNTIILNYL